ncbi:PREDICTED: lipoamide acyltransferase component of branched-chain alpha-keto acid dehydrogenase complex, mitochondrial [Erythranthe guttata]|uniref:lipoamide acyltransferase component of branched-chain alpha-keto acid dehydrogenase complex, mitochondrial n=1 Tax=Erythranthe guttata TaxID=4155 RepID=UPI00064E0413|nr:PREDICTED: lipoamide acyltransferase component of branched-chain alpha-keto acid dehydrogenase complex, mitochondrial [Erythranthe guttata]|eukprot:XP_012827500.1 PREDICTED: lipoamide acyltransferase component of branched-chain alpha-keto acid dehydrogenase complex, mitochondrial [Erythranthe guttata]
MICRKICQKNSRSFSQWRRFLVYSAAAPQPSITGEAARRANFEVGSLFRAQVSIFTNPRTSIWNGGNSSSIPFGIKWCRFTTQTMPDHRPIGGVVDVPLAQTGEGIAECELLKWFVQEGDQVEEFQPLCEVQSDKATIEITSRYKGKVYSLLHIPGNIVKVGETLLKMVVDETAFSSQSVEAPEIIKAHDLCIKELDIVDSKVKNDGPVLSTPAVRNFAKQLGVNIEEVCGTGKDGRILKDDVVSYAEGVSKESSSSVNASCVEKYLGAEEKSQDISLIYGQEFEDRIIPLRYIYYEFIAFSTLVLYQIAHNPLNSEFFRGTFFKKRKEKYEVKVKMVNGFTFCRGFQRAMVKSMTLAAKIPHFHYVDEINCNALVELKASFQSENSDPSVKYTFLPVLIKSLSMALTKFPLLNSSFNEQLQEVTLKGSHNIGIAMATPHGLVVPNIKKVQCLSISEITKELSRLQQLALANKLSSDDISGGTITLSNIGAIGGKFGSPLINVPEASIIAIGRIQKLPQFDEDGNIYPASVMTINIGSDHRVLDGATVAKFCNEWKLFIEKPELLMLHMR